MADARDLKSLIPKGVCGFESRRRQLIGLRLIGSDREGIFWHSKKAAAGQ